METIIDRITDILLIIMITAAGGLCVFMLYAIAHMVLSAGACT